ncbi:MAG: hypothetical protein VKJ64_08490 [Leptolyngbyaceae bacterium]|nr:hypothetical protein [Leptolyngbyaceae bacterium]
MSLEQQVMLLTRDSNRTAEEVELLRADMNKRFDTLEQRFDTLEQRFDTLEQRFDILEERFSRLETDVRLIIELLQSRS